MDVTKNVYLKQLHDAHFPEGVMPAALAEVESIIELDLVAVLWQRDGDWPINNGDREPAVHVAWIDVKWLLLWFFRTQDKAVFDGVVWQPVHVEALTAMMPLIVSVGYRWLCLLIITCGYMTPFKSVLMGYHIGQTYDRILEAALSVDQWVMLLQRLPQSLVVPLLWTMQVRDPSLWKQLCVQSPAIKKTPVFVETDFSVIETAVWNPKQGVDIAIVIGLLYMAPVKNNMAILIEFEKKLKQHVIQPIKTKSDFIIWHRLIRVIRLYPFFSHYCHEALTILLDSILAYQSVDKTKSILDQLTPMERDVLLEKVTVYVDQGEVAQREVAWQLRKKMIIWYTIDKDKI